MSTHARKVATVDDVNQRRGSYQDKPKQTPNRWRRTPQPGAAAIIWFEDETGEKKILVGKESNYVSDIFANKTNFTDEDRELLDAMENLTVDDINRVKEVCRDFTNELEYMIKDKNILRDTRIQYDTPEKTMIKIKDEDDKPGYSLKYRYLHDNFRKGVIKGGYNEEADKKNEDGSNNTKETIMREIREEVGMKVEPKDVILIGKCEDYDVYSIKIPQKHIKTFENAIKSRKERKSGEVYDLEFTKLSTIRSELRNYNFKSICAIDVFVNMINVPGGKRKTTNRKTTNRKTTNRNRKTNKRH
jgi:8-oxo-dGTP pyrophosphatase MutT (NUDIX family)